MPIGLLLFIVRRCRPPSLFSTDIRLVIIRSSLVSCAAFFNDGRRRGVFFLRGTWRQFSPSSRRCVLLIPSRRPSELASLRCDAAFMIINAEHIRFIPSHLSKTDRQRHLGSPILVLRLPPAPSGDVSLCPVASVESLLRRRRDLGVEHDFLFSSPSPPHRPIEAAEFSELLRWSFRSAGISAPPGSTRATSVSDAFARGVNVSDILAAGDWSGSRTFFRHYLRPSSTVVQPVASPATLS